MNHYVVLSLTNRKSYVHLHALYSPRTALRTFTPRRDQLVICGQYSCAWAVRITASEVVGVDKTATEHNLDCL
jgi:hypothetical protein